LEEVVQLLISGISQGCVYGLIALGFVLIYKATEMVNFAQGDIMMLGAFFAFTYLNILEWNFFLALIATLVTMAAFGALLERVVLRPMIGQPPFSVLMLTIGLGFILRAVAGAIWGACTSSDLVEPFDPISKRHFSAGDFSSLTC